jgi:predicted restriction endonuclease
MFFAPNLRRAFDSGLITISVNHELFVSAIFSKTDSSYNIHPFAGRTILLPKEAKYYPAKENSFWH